MEKDHALMRYCKNRQDGNPTESDDDNYPQFDPTLRRAYFKIRPSSVTFRRFKIGEKETGMDFIINFKYLANPRFIVYQIGIHFNNQVTFDGLYNIQLFKECEPEKKLFVREGPCVQFFKQGNDYTTPGQPEYLDVHRYFTPLSDTEPVIVEMQYVLIPKLY